MSRKEAEPTPQAPRPVIPVAAGCLVDDRGAVLIAQRPAGKIAAGKWEFPGGKVEPGESPRAALGRELHEELGIEVIEARPLIRIRHDYSDRSVILDTWRIVRWSGELHGREAQAFDWVMPEKLPQHDLLAADLPIVTALRLPTDYVFCRPDASEVEIRAGLARLPGGALLRLRLPELQPARYAQLARGLLPDARAAGVQLVLDRAADLAGELATHWHASAARVGDLVLRPTLAPGCMAFASCHDLAEATRARQLGFDAVVAGPVLPTATHPGATPLGWDGFAAIAAQAQVPAFAIGGLGREDLDRAFAHYAQGIAGISAYWS
ncbi:MAG TPA: Nudix family hydrolase [Solimonas sp.]|nr:Nudix family hydrolase [Solimonas sp.]